jgi:hypothetical protein
MGTSLAMLLTTYTFMPMGGAIIPMLTVISTKIPNQMALPSAFSPHKSKPMMAGKITGMVNSSMDNSSITQPSNTYSTNTKMTMLRSGMGKCVTHSAMILGISVSAKVAFIMSAPKKIMKTMAVVSAVLSNAFFKPSAFSSRLNRPASRVMAAPTAAPSVGENTPP